MKKPIILATVIISLLALAIGPVYGQDGTSHTVAFDGIRITFDEALARHVNIVQYPGDPLDYEAPGGPEPAYVAFNFYNTPPAPETFLDEIGGVRVYPTASFAGYTFVEERYQTLQTLLADRPDLAAYMAVEENLSAITLPFIPVFPAGQIIRARAAYVDTPAFSGISFVTAYRQDAFPFMHDNFIWTLQGISADGTLYISAVFPLTTSLFPAEIGADFNYDAWIAEIQTYFTDSIALLNSGSPQDFAPSLDLLEATVTSIAFAD